MALDISVAIFFWIEFRRIGWQIFHMDIRMVFQELSHDFTSMSRRSIPDQDESALDLAYKMFQSDQQFFGIDRAFKMPFVDLARNCQTDHRRDFPAKFGDPFQLRGFAFRGPGKTDWFCIGKSKFIFKHDLCAEPPRFFLSGASPDSARRGSTLRLAPLPLGLLFARSNPDRPIDG